MAKNDYYFSLSRAAKETGKSKSVISKALKNGTISNHGKDQSGYKIDPAELFRVFPRKEPENGLENENKERLSTPKNDLENALKIKELELELKSETKEKDFYKIRYENMEAERDDWKKQAQTLLLKAPTENPSQKSVEAVSNSSDRVGAGTLKQAARQPNFAAIAVLFLVALGIGYFISEINSFRRDLEAISPEQNVTASQREILNRLKAIETASGTKEPNENQQTVAVKDDKPEISNITEEGSLIDPLLDLPISEIDPPELMTSPRD